MLVAVVMGACAYELVGYKLPGLDPIGLTLYSETLGNAEFCITFAPTPGFVPKFEIKGLVTVGLFVLRVVINFIRFLN